MMKKELAVFLSLFISVILVCFFASCSDKEEKRNNSAKPKETVIQTKNEPGGVMNETVNWRYDSSTSTFYFYGTGLVDRSDGVIHGEESDCLRAAVSVCFEEGITDAEKYTLSWFDNVKYIYLPSSYVGSFPEAENVEKYIVAENNPVYSSDENGVLYNADKTKMIYYPINNKSETYKIPDGVTSISSEAFVGNKYLKNILIPYSLNSISISSFENSALYDNPENWDGDAFYVDKCLVKVERKTEEEYIMVKDGTEKIFPFAFSNCKNIKSITVPDSVKIIGHEAFESCVSLETVYLGSGVESIGIAPFVFDIEGSPCSSLKSIEVSKENKHYVSVDGVLFNKEMTELIQYPIGKEQMEYVIPDSVTTIGYGAFCYCNELTKLTVGKGITEIDGCLLFGCNNIETVILPETVKKLDGGAFKYSGIKYIDIPDSVTYLGSEAMAACPRLETINIGKGVSEIDGAAIYGDILKEIKVHKDNQFFSDKDGVLFNKDKTELLLYPPNKSGETYHIPDSVKIIKIGAVREARNLNKIYVGSNVQTIEWGNFYETVYDPETEYKNETRYEIYYDGTEKQWNEIFEDKYEREEIDKTKVIYLK